MAREQRVPPQAYHSRGDRGPLSVAPPRAAQSPGPARRNSMRARAGAAERRMPTAGGGARARLSCRHGPWDGPPRWSPHGSEHVEVLRGPHLLDPLVDERVRAQEECERHRTDPSDEVRPHGRDVAFGRAGGRLELRRLQRVERALVTVDEDGHRAKVEEEGRRAEALDDAPARRGQRGRQHEAAREGARVRVSVRVWSG
eukprot:875021-Prymnesium_polylepis.1